MQTNDSIPGCVDDNSGDFALKNIGRSYDDEEEKEKGQVETALDDPVNPCQNR